MAVRNGIRGPVPLGQLGDQRVDAPTEIIQRFRWFCAIEIVNFPVFDSVHPRRKMGLHHGAMFGCLNGNYTISID